MKYSPMAHPAYGARYCMGAESAAFAATTTVCSMAPYRSSTATVWATLATRCPIATYMQIRSPSFWLIIVSRQRAVFPVARSPMISSLWPRPTGTIESMAFTRSAPGR